MDFARFSQILATCTALPEQKCIEIEQAAMTLDEGQMEAFAVEISGLNARMAELNKKEAAILENLDKFMTEGTRTLRNADRKEREQRQKGDDDAYLSSLLPQ